MSAPLDAAEVAARARALAPQVAALAAEAEAMRRVPPALIAAIRDAGLARILTPRRFGGHELPLDVFFDAVLEIARADASIAWCFSFINIHAWLLAGFSEQAQADVWGADPDACIANVNLPVGRVTVVDGGYRLSGEWPFASGIDHADAAILAGVVPPAAGAPDGPPDVRLFVVPRADLTIADTWKVAGQRATGSNTAVVTDAFVPAHRVTPLVDLREATAPGRDVHAGPLYRLPLVPVLALSLVAPILGAARGAFDRWRALVRVRVTSYSREQVAALSHQQIRMAEVAADIDCAELLVRRDLELLRRGDLDLADRVLIRRDYGHAARLCVRAVEAIYTASGAAANLDSSPLQRPWRDIHAMAAHAGINFDAAGENFGRVALGLPNNPKDPLF